MSNQPTAATMDNQTKKKSKSTTTPIAILLILIYLIVAMGDNFKGIFVPFFKSEFSVNNTQIGYVMTASLFAYAVFQYIGGILIERIGYKKVLSMGFIMGMAAILVLINCLNFPMLILGMFLLNIGMAMFNIGVNTLGPALPIASTAVLMNVINGSYAFGNTALQRVSGKLLARGIPWRSFFKFMLVAALALFIYMLIIKIPYQPAKRVGGNSQIFKSSTIYLYIIAAGGYLAAEYGIGNWFVNYMNETFGMAADKSSLYIAIFFGAKAVGLMFGGFIADKLGHFRCILIYGIGATVTSVLGIALGEKGLILFALGGLAYSAIFPTLITTISGAFKESTSYATGLILMCGTLIAMVVSMLIGVLNDHIGTHIAFFIIAISVAVTTITSQILAKTLKPKETN